MEALAYRRQERQLNEVFGFGHDLIRDGVVDRAGAASRSYLGGLFPPAAPGYARWMYAVHFLGEVTINLGYQRCDADQVCSVRHDGRRLRIVPVAGNALTGIEPTSLHGKGPSTKYPRGERTQRAVQLNQQLGLWGQAPRAGEVEPAVSTYMLLMYASGVELRSEISRPEEINVRGYVTRWGPRYILPAINFTTDGPDLYDQTGDPIEIDVDPL